jgi:hypothetical protein
MIVSIAMAVLPVPRSPMISSRWPRPIGNHGVDRLDAGLQRLLHRLPHDDARGDHLHRAGRHRGDRAATVHRLAQRVHHPAQHPRPGRHLEEAAGAADLVAFLELQVVAHDRGAHVVLLEVQHQPVDDLAGFGRGELQHLARQRGLEAVDARDAVAHFEGGPDVGRVGLRQVGRLDFLEEDALDFTGRRIESVAMIVVSNRRKTGPLFSL